MELLGLDKTQLASLCRELGCPTFRAKQIAEWMYAKGARSFAEMTNLPAVLREQLAERAELTRSEVVTTSTADDGTAKYLLRFGDGQTVEAVLLPYADRLSVCVSSQIGCPAGCVFCATADCGFARNLTGGEIVDQVLTLQELAARRITHVVFMGMGEPLLNYDNVMGAVRVLNSEVGIGMRRLTISTIGIPQAIRRLMTEDLQLTLAVSLHAPNDEMRRRLIPLSARHPLGEVVSTCREYAETTKRRVTFEYLLLGGINDSPVHAEELARLLRHTLCNVNLIPYNRVPGKPFQRPRKEAIKAFRGVLEAHGVDVTQRLERGHEVAAACGQLKRHHINGAAVQRKKRSVE